MDMKRRHPKWYSIAGVTWTACVVAGALVAATALPASAQNLRGSRASVDRQNREARQHDFTFLRRPSQLERFVDAGLLVPLEGGDDYRLHDVSFNVARPEVKLFIERLSAQYLASCGERLVVTSLTRPTSLQPANASERSVHPTGMAVDLRVPRRASCRRWLESTFLSLERRRLLDATLERSPLHFHVAVFPDDYLAYVSRLTGRSGDSLLASVEAARHTVRPSDTLWEIARRYGTTPARIREANGLKSSVIHPGQTLKIPGNS
jgi:nucleoid-associated protein YgaU